MDATNGGSATGDAALASRLAEIERTTREPNAPLRNLLITQSYHELAASIAAVIGNGNANWSFNRMAFIADLFRSQQCDPTLFTPPFAPNQVAAMRTGRMPTGSL